MPTLIPLMTETLLWVFPCTSCSFSSNSVYICYLHIFQVVLKLCISYVYLQLFPVWSYCWYKIL